MIFHYAGKYDGDESKLPQKEHHPHAVQFKELEDTKKLSLIANNGCVLTMVLLAIPFLLLGIKYIPDNAIWMMIGGICGGLSLLPHELLHAICYKEDVYMYNDLAHGLMFVVGTEDMSKGHFIFIFIIIIFVNNNLKLFRLQHHILRRGYRHNSPKAYPANTPLCR